MGGGRRPRHSRHVHAGGQVPSPPAGHGLHRPRRHRRLLDPGHRRPAGHPGPLRRPDRRRRPGRGRVLGHHAQRRRPGHGRRLPVAGPRPRRRLPVPPRVLARDRGAPGPAARLGPPGPAARPGRRRLRRRPRPPLGRGYERAWRAGEPEAAAALYAPTPITAPRRSATRTWAATASSPTPAAPMPPRPPRTPASAPRSRRRPVPRPRSNGGPPCGRRDNRPP